MTIAYVLRLTSETDTGTAAVAIPATRSTGSITISGTEQPNDTGTISVGTNGEATSVSWGPNSTAQTIAAALSTAIQQTFSSYVSVSELDDTISGISLASETGTGANLQLSCSATDSQSSVPSFLVACDGMTGGTNGTTGPQPLYNYSVPSGGYAPNGNLLLVTDSVMGIWAYGYDSLNRLTGADVVAGTYNGLNVAGASLGWTYDPFGNALAQSSTFGGFPSGSLQFPGTNNQATMNNLGATLQYDASGDTTYDGTTHYVYDAEGRICAASNGTGGYTQYIYDAEGQRVAKGSVSSLSCNLAANSFMLTSSYVLDLQGRQLSELGSTGAWIHSNVFANGALLVTYNGNDTYFALNDWLGTKRVQVTPDGKLTSFSSLPFGNGLVSSNGILDATEHHFTGKERDTESGLDYFGARYYGSSMGRWTSPDPSGLAYADPTNPQSLNLYSYVLNNPLSFIDPDGLECVWDDGSFDSADDKDTGSQSQCSGAGGSYVDPKAFSTLGAGDWSNQANQSIANIAQALNGGSTEVNVSANGNAPTVDVNYAYTADGGILFGTQHLTGQSDPIQQLATGVTADSNHDFGCIAQAYGFGGPGETARYMGQPVANTKRFLQPGASIGTSPISDFARSLPRVKGRYLAPTGGLGTGKGILPGAEMTGSLNVAAARWAPFLGLAADAYATTQLWNCLGH